MRVLLLGSGARAHALTNRIVESGGEVWCIPMVELWLSNPQVHAGPVHASLKEVAAWASEVGIHLVIGLDEFSAFDDAAAYFEAEHIMYFAPTRAAARLEWSKLHARRVLERLGFELPALLHVATDPTDRTIPGTFPVVLKLDRADSARGVRFANDPAEFAASFDELVRVHAASSGTEPFAVLVEAFVTGPEVTFAVLAGRGGIVELPPVRDYKHLEDGDLGPLTSGMGGYSPVPALAPGWEAFRQDLFTRVLDHMACNGSRYTGYLNANVVHAEGRWVVLELNCHMGDPDLVLLLPQIEGDVALLMHDLAVGADLSGAIVRPRPSVAVSLVQAGYPVSAVATDRAIWPPVAGGHDLYLYKAQRSGGQLFPQGGRVLLACATSRSFRDAVQGAYRTAEAAHGANPALVYRRDVGLEAAE